MTINNSDKEFYDRKVALARQKGTILKLDQGLIDLVKAARKKFQIPLEYGFQTSEQVAEWNSTIKRNMNNVWQEELDKIIVYLKKPVSWKSKIEKLILMDFLAAPPLSYSEVDNHNGEAQVTTRFIQTDSPALKDDLIKLLKENDVKNIKPRLFKDKDLEINIAIIELSRKLNNDFKKVAVEINKQFNTDYQDFDISDKKAKFAKRIVKERMP